jgi:hypothetical protein
MHADPGSPRRSPHQVHGRLSNIPRTGRAIEDTEKPILVGLHQHMALGRAAREVGQGQLLGSVKVPFISGRNLVFASAHAG